MGNFLEEETPIEGINLNPAFKQISVDEQKYKSILNDMVLAFYKQRKGCETESRAEDYCRKILDTCISGFRDGRLWKNAPGRNTNDWWEALSLRLRVYKYDLATKRLIPGREKIVSEKIKNIPKGDESFVERNAKTFSRGEEEMMKDFQKRFTEEFPSSVTVIDEAMIKRLSYLAVLSERDIREIEVSKDLTKEIREITESLGVSGKQRSSVLNSEKNGTLEQLSLKYKRTLEEHIEIERNYQLEELKMISNAVRRDENPLPEFLAMYHLKILYGKSFPNGEELSIQNLVKFLKENGIDVRD